MPVLANKNLDFSEIESKASKVTLLECSQYKDICYLEEAFISEKRWELKHELAYLTSVFRGLHLTPFIIVDVEECLKNAKRENRRVDIEYYESILAMGYKFITCDSVNRQSSLWESLVENKFPLPQGTFQIDGETYKFTGKTFWKDLSVTDQGHISKVRKVLVQTITSATRQDLADIFDAVNKGVQQNAQEIRQSWLSDLGQPIRDLSKKIRDKFLDGNILTTKETNRRFIDEILVDFCQYCHIGFTNKYNKTYRDMWYVEASPLSRYVNKIDEIFNNVNIPKVGKSKNGRPLKAKTTLRAILMNVFLRLWLEDNNYKVKDHQAFDNWIYALDQKFLAVPAHITVSKQVVPNPEHPAGQFINDKGITYPYKSAGRRHVDFLLWNFKLFKKELMSKSLVVDLDSQRLATPEQKYQVWKFQNGKTPTGEEIPLEQLLDHTKWQADHIIRHTDGGQTTLDNLQMISAAANLAKAHILSGSEAIE